LKTILSEAKGVYSRVEVITSASEFPVEVGENYIRAFTKLGCYNVRLMHIASRKDAANPEYLNRLQQADVVFFSGGDQVRLTTFFKGMEFMEILHDRYLQDDFIIAGTSAGAMVMSGRMICRGNSALGLVKGEVEMAEGLNLLSAIIIDTHFVNRGRFGRLMQAVAMNAGCIGMGLGEDTGVIITNGNQMRTIGSGMVVIIDGHAVDHQMILAVAQGAPLSIENIKMHIMTRDSHFQIIDGYFVPAAAIQQSNE
jgi:cyanophycinase